MQDQLIFNIELIRVRQMTHCGHRLVYDSFVAFWSASLLLASPAPVGFMMDAIRNSLLSVLPSKGLSPRALRPSSSVLRPGDTWEQSGQPTMVASALHISYKFLKAKARVTWGDGALIADTLAEPASPVRALIWPPTGRCRDAQLVPVESILSPVVIELHLEDPVLAEALPV
jgi:hypothetical protein